MININHHHVAPQFLAFIEDTLLISYGKAAGDVCDMVFLTSFAGMTVL